MLIAYIRSILLYLILIVSVRLMGKRQIGEMEPSEFVVTMLLANLASIPMQDVGTPLLSGVVPILTVLALELMLSVLSMRSVRLRRLFCGKPEILLENGVIDQAALRRSRITADELSELLRQQGVTDLKTVQYAILETNGNLSVLPLPRFVPASAQDAGVPVPVRSLPVTLISDGRLVTDNLPEAGVTEAWVQDYLRAAKLEQKEVFLLTREPTGAVYLAKKEKAR